MPTPGHPAGAAFPDGTASGAVAPDVFCPCGCGPRLPRNPVRGRWNDFCKSANGSCPMGAGPFRTERMTACRNISTDRVCPAAAVDPAPTRFRTVSAAVKPMPASASRLRRKVYAMRRVVWLFFAATAVSCGLADDDRDEKNRYEYIAFSDAAFEGYCLGAFDLNADGRISVYEARRVVRIDCPDLGIRSLYDIRYFVNLRRLDCSGNAVTDLDVAPLAYLERLDCSRNRLTRLGIGDLRGLTALYCSENVLPVLDLRGTASLTTFEGRSNAYTLLDLRRCAPSLRAVVTDNPSLETVYCLPSQSIDADGHTRLVRE